MADTSARWHTHEERATFSDGSWISRMSSGVYAAWHLDNRCEIYSRSEIDEAMKLADGYESMLALVRFAAELAEPVTVVCENCECKTRRDTAVIFTDVFGGLTAACQECVDITHAEIEHEHDTSFVGCSHAACERLRATVDELRLQDKHNTISGASRVDVWGDCEF